MTNITRVTAIAFAAMAVMAATAAAAPAPAHAHTLTRASAADVAVAPRTGTFRAILRAKDGSVVPALITIEKIDGGLGILVVTDAPTALDIVSITDDEVVARMRTSTGYARVTLKVTDDAVSGQVVEGKRVWSVDGKRTS